MRNLIIGIITILYSLTLVSCEQPSDPNKIKLVYVEWASEVASSNVVRVALESAGYNVEMLPVSAAAMWQAVATGAADATVSAWLPTGHKYYYDRVKDMVVDLGVNLKGTEVGLVVPNYVTIDSIDQLNQFKDKFKSEIIGIDPGAGMMSKTEKLIKDYHLDFRLINGSGATMTAALAYAISQKQWIVVTGWKPHWMFSRWKLKFLKDPKKIFGQNDTIQTIVRKGLKKDKPRAYEVLQKFHWTPQDMQEVMLLNHEKKASPHENAKQWLKAHPALLKQWLSQSS